MTNKEKKILEAMGFQETSLEGLLEVLSEMQGERACECKSLYQIRSLKFTDEEKVKLKKLMSFLLRKALELGEPDVIYFIVTTYTHLEFPKTDEDDWADVIDLVDNMFSD